MRTEEAHRYYARVTGSLTCNACGFVLYQSSEYTLRCTQQDCENQGLEFAIPKLELGDPIGRVDIFGRGQKFPTKA